MYGWPCIFWVVFFFFGKKQHITHLNSPHSYTGYILSCIVAPLPSLTLSRSPSHRGLIGLFLPFCNNGFPSIVAKQNRKIAAHFSPPPQKKQGFFFTKDFELIFGWHGTVCTFCFTAPRPPYDNISNQSVYIRLCKALVVCMALLSPLLVSII